MTRAEWNGLISEFGRYVLVGGLAFVADFVTLTGFHEWIIPTVPYSLYIATLLGFVVGISINYVLSVSFVFLSVKKWGIGRTRRDQFLFLLIGVVGLVMTELGMVLGVEVLSLHYQLVKIFLTGAVLVWNYGARKVFIFNKKQAKNEEETL